MPSHPLPARTLACVQVLKVASCRKLTPAVTKSLLRLRNLQAFDFWDTPRLASSLDTPAKLARELPGLPLKCVRGLRTVQQQEAGTKAQPVMRDPEDASGRDSLFDDDSLAGDSQVWKEYQSGIWQHTVPPPLTVSAKNYMQRSNSGRASCELLRELPRSAAKNHL